jgi:hypothetical protein
MTLKYFEGVATSPGNARLNAEQRQVIGHSDGGSAIVVDHQNSSHGSRWSMRPVFLLNVHCSGPD